MVWPFYSPEKQEVLCYSSHHTKARGNRKFCMLALFTHFFPEWYYISLYVCVLLFIASTCNTSTYIFLSVPSHAWRGNIWSSGQAISLPSWLDTCEYLVFQSVSFTRNVIFFFLGRGECPDLFRGAFSIRWEAHRWIMTEILCDSN